MKNKIYSLIHKILNIFPPRSRESRCFFAFFTSASILELTLSKTVLHLAEKGLYDLHTAYRIAPAMTESALITLFLAILCSVILDRNISENKENS